MKFEPDAIYCLCAVTAGLFALGGSGALPIRRFGIPFAIALVALFHGASVYSLFFLIASTIGVLCLGYGDDIYKKLGVLYWPWVLGIGFLYSLSQFGLCFSFGGWLRLILFSVLTSIVFGGGMLFSKAGLVHWKIIELATGFFIGLTAVEIIVHKL